MKLMKIISEITEPKEGVADKFAQNDPRLANVPTEFNKDYIEKNVEKEKNGEVIYHSADMKIIKNPTNLNGIGRSVRGVITANGDLYIEDESQGIHNDILTILKNKGILPSTTTKKWGGELPQQSGFLTVQRFNDTNTLAIGESNRLLYSKEGWERYIQYYQQFLDKAQSNSSEIHYSNKLIGIKTGSSTHDNILNH